VTHVCGGLLSLAFGFNTIYIFGIVGRSAIGLLPLVTIKKYFEFYSRTCIRFSFLHVSFKSPLYPF
jgi:hypothetical protein